MIAHSFGWVPSCLLGRTDPGDPGAIRSRSPSTVLSSARVLMPSFTKTWRADGLEEPHAPAPGVRLGFSHDPLTYNRPPEPVRPAAVAAPPRRPSPASQRLGCGPGGWALTALDMGSSSRGGRPARPAGHRGRCWHPPSRRGRPFTSVEDPVGSLVCGPQTQLAVCPASPLGRPLGQSTDATDPGVADCEGKEARNGMV